MTDTTLLVCAGAAVALVPSVVSLVMTNRLGKRIDALGARMDDRLDVLSRILDGIAARLDGLAGRVNMSDAHLGQLGDGIHQQLTTALATLHGIDTRLDPPQPAPGDPEIGNTPS